MELGPGSCRGPDVFKEGIGFMLPPASVIGGSIGQVDLSETRHCYKTRWLPGQTRARVNDRVEQQWVNSFGKLTDDCASAFSPALPAEQHLRLQASDMVWREEVPTVMKRLDGQGFGFTCPSTDPRTFELLLGASKRCRLADSQVIANCTALRLSAPGEFPYLTSPSSQELGLEVGQSPKFVSTALCPGVGVNGVTDICVPLPGQHGMGSKAAVQTPCGSLVIESFEEHSWQLSVSDSDGNGFTDWIVQVGDALLLREPQPQAAAPNEKLLVTLSLDYEGPELLVPDLSMNDLETWDEDVRWYDIANKYISQDLSLLRPDANLMQVRRGEQRPLSYSHFVQRARGDIDISGSVTRYADDKTEACAGWSFGLRCSLTVATSHEVSMWLGSYKSGEEGEGYASPRIFSGIFPPDIQTAAVLPWTANSDGSVLFKHKGSMFVTTRSDAELLPRTRGKIVAESDWVEDTISEWINIKKSYLSDRMK